MERKKNVFFCVSVTNAKRYFDQEREKEKEKE